MKRILKQNFWLLALLVVSAIPAAAQTPYPSLSFEREQNKDGSVDYVLRPMISEIHKRFGDNFRIVGVVARPATRKAVLLLVNAQPQFQLDVQAVKSVVITADSAEIGNLTYDVVAKGKEDSLVKFEIGNTLISFEDFQRIASANSVVLKFGAVTHQLDKENREALRFLVAEIQKDQKPN
ncbi:MAG: hypothetical protein M3539_18645 [Acidobacteriota bacterium]|nr:hypothetical protein [Acidobacteriota bacterium]